MQTSSIKNSILDRNIYYDMTGKEIKHGDIVGGIYSSEIKFGIIEYTTFNVIHPNEQNKNNDINYGIMFHIYKNPSKCIKQLGLDNQPPKIEKRDFTNSDYSNQFYCEVMFDKLFSMKNPIVQAIKFNLSNLKERFSEDDYNLFLNVQKQILNNEYKIYPYYELN